MLRPGTNRCTSGVWLAGLLLTLGAFVFVCGQPEAWAAASKTSGSKTGGTKSAAPKAAKPAKPAKKKSTEEKPIPVSELPWALRDHYTFAFDNADFIFGVDNAQWTLEVKGMGEVLTAVGATVTLADASGTVLDLADFGKGESKRYPVTGDLGEGTEYRTILPAKDGLAPFHLVGNYKTRPFFTMQVEVANTGDKPIEIAKISPVVIRPGKMAHLGPNTTAAMRHIAMRGPFPVFDKAAAPGMVLLHDPDHDFTLAFAVIAGGVASSGITFEKDGDGWKGEATCVFDPPVRLEPGARLRSDAIWVTFTNPKPAEVDAIYAWAHSARAERLKPTQPVPECWVTTPETTGDGDPLAALYDGAKTWASVGVRHALVPQDAALLKSPKEMAKAAQTLKALGISPGLTLDALLVSEASGALTAPAQEGGHWLNASTPQGLQLGIQQARQTINSTFDFFVVPRSAIPADALKRFNMTRTQADSAALRIVCEAAGGKPVFPSAATTLGTDLEDWLEAAGVTARLREYQVLAGPIRLAASADQALNDDLVRAISFVGAPIEFVAGRGKPPSEVARILPRPKFFAHPVDVGQTAPKTWQLQSFADYGKPASEGAGASVVVTFPGSSGWDVKLLSGRTN